MLMISKMHYMAKSMRTPLVISGFGYFSQTHCWQVHKIKHTAMQSPSTNIGGRMGRTEELSDVQHQWRHQMPPFQQVSSSNFCPARSAPVNCKCCSYEMETSRSNNSSATKWSASQAHRMGPLSAEARSTEKSFVASYNTHYWVLNWLWKQRQCKHCSSRASWNGFPWPSSRTQA